MARGNGKSEVDPAELDPEHELPASDETQDIGQGSDFDKLKSERDSLIERLARLQAEFENARKRTAREQQEFREYAVSDALKALLPSLDSAHCRLALPTSRSSVAASNSSTNNFRTLSANWDCAPSRRRVNLLILTFIRPLKWWTPPTPRIIMFSTNCSAATN
jgi:SMC interacting uncharacterized protein involved in chromosome segregation